VGVSVESVIQILKKTVKPIAERLGPERDDVSWRSHGWRGVRACTLYEEIGATSLWRRKKVSTGEKVVGGGVGKPGDGEVRWTSWACGG
jgi:hypothetical protein